MKSKLCLSVILVFCLSACAIHRNHQGTTAFLSPVSEDQLRQNIQDFVQSKAASGETASLDSVDIIPLPLNEQFIYKVKWLGLTVGTVKISIKDMKVIQDRPAYVVEALAETAGFFRVWPVHDRFLSYMDAENLSVLRQEVYRREGKYKKDAVVDFDRSKAQAHYRHLLDGTNKTYDVPADVQDALTSFYYFRANDLKAGDQFRFAAYADEKSYEIFGQIQHDAPLKISGMGVLPAYSVKPQAKYGDELINDAKAQFYFSADTQKIPLKVVVHGPIFSSITLTLEQIIREG